MGGKLNGDGKTQWGKLRKLNGDAARIVLNEEMRSIRVGEWRDDPRMPLEDWHTTCSTVPWHGCRCTRRSATSRRLSAFWARHLRRRPSACFHTVPRKWSVGRGPRPLFFPWCSTGEFTGAHRVYDPDRGCRNSRIGVAADAGEHETLAFDSIRRHGWGRDRSDSVGMARFNGRCGG
jgi:hypothetical protein